MLICDQELVKYNGVNESSKYYTEQVNKIRSSGKKTFIFQSNKSSKNRISEDGRNIRDIPLTTTIPKVSHRLNKDTGASEWWWYVDQPSTIKFKDGETPEKRPGAVFKKNLLMVEKLTLDVNKDIELIFYLLNCSKLLQSGRIFMFDKESELNKANLLLEEESQAKGLVFMKDSIISPERLGDDKIFKRIASAYGVNNTDAKTTNEIKQSLWSNLLRFEAQKATSGKSYATFIRDCNSTRDIEVAANVNTCISRGIITFNDNDRYYYIRTKEGSTIKLVNIGFDKDDTKADILVNFVQSEKAISNLIKEACDDGLYERIVKESSVVNANPVITNDDYNEDQLMTLANEEYETYKELCKKYGVRAVGVKKEDSIKELLSVMK